MNRERNRMCAAVQSPAWDFLHHGPAVTTAAPDRNIAAVVPAGIRLAVKLWSAPEKNKQRSFSGQGRDRKSLYYYSMVNKQQMIER